jgi:hypothetical protein
MRRRLPYAFAAIPDFIVNDPHTKPRDVDILVRLQRHFKGACRIIETDHALAEILGIHESTWKETLSRLSARGFIRIVKGAEYWFRGVWRKARRALDFPWLAPQEAPVKAVHQPLFSDGREAEKSTPEGTENPPLDAIPPKNPPIAQPKEDNDKPAESLSSSAPPAGEERIAAPRATAAKAVPAPAASTLPPEVLEKARQVDSIATEWAVAAARRTGAVASIGAVIDTAWKKVRRLGPGAIKNLGGYLNSGLARQIDQYALSGPPTKKDPPALAEEAHAAQQRREEREAQRKRDEEAPTTEADIEQAKKWLEAGDRRLQDLGRAMLDKARKEALL